MANNKGYPPFAQAFQAKVQGYPHKQYAELLGVTPNTIRGVMSGARRPGVYLMRRILDKHRDLYEVAMEVYFGPRPGKVERTEPGLSSADAFGLAFKRFQGERTNAEYASFLGIGYLTVYTVWKGAPVPDIYILQRIVAKVPELYDLAAAVHFGPRTEVEMAKAPKIIGLPR